MIARAERQMIAVSVDRRAGCNCEIVPRRRRIDRGERAVSADRDIAIDRKWARGRDRGGFPRGKLGERQCACVDDIQRSTEGVCYADLWSDGFNRVGSGADTRRGKQAQRGGFDLGGCIRRGVGDRAIPSIQRHRSRSGNFRAKRDALTENGDGICRREIASHMHGVRAIAGGHGEILVEMGIGCRGYGDRVVAVRAHRSVDHQIGVVPKRHGFDRDAAARS